MTTQTELDEATAVLAKVIARLDGLARNAKAEADALCMAGAFEASTDVGLIEEKLRQAAAAATGAYRLGRALSLPSDGGVITPSFGGNK